MSKRHRDSKNLEFAIKVSVNKKTYEQIGEESARDGISMAEVLRRAYYHRMSEADINTCSHCVFFKPGKNGDAVCSLDKCAWEWEAEDE